MSLGLGLPLQTSQAASLSHRNLGSSGFFPDLSACLVDSIFMLQPPQACTGQTSGLLFSQFQLEEGRLHFNTVHL